MAPPARVARRVRQTAARVARIPDQAVADAAEHTVTLAEQAGGGFTWGRLGARIVRQSNRRGAASVTIQGDPPGAWSIKSYGRRGGYVIRSRRGGPVDLRRAGTPNRAAWSVRPGPARGDDRWRRRVMEPAGESFGDTVADLTREAVTDGR